MGSPDPDSLASRVFALLSGPRTIDDVAYAFDCSHLSAERAVHSLLRHKRVRRVYRIADWQPMYVRPDCGWSRTAYAAKKPRAELPTTCAKELLRAAIESRGLTQSDVAKISGVAQTHISAALDPKRRGPSPEALRKILAALCYGMTLVDLTKLEE